MQRYRVQRVHRKQPPPRDYRMMHIQTYIRTHVVLEIEDMRHLLLLYRDRNEQNEPQSVEQLIRRQCALAGLGSRPWARARMMDDGTASSGILRHFVCYPTAGLPSPASFCFYHTSLGHIPLSALSTQLRPSQQEQKQRGSAGYIADLGALDNTSRCDPQALSETASSGPGSLEPRADADSVRRTLAWATHCETSVDSAPTLFPAMMGHDA